MLPIYLTVAAIIALPFLYLLRIEVAWKALVKRQARIEREYNRKVCLGESAKSARAWADGKHAEVPSFDRMIWSVWCWQYEDYFKEDLK